MEAVKEAVISGLQGAFIHSDPLVILKDLTPEIARKKALGFTHSCWDLLYHTVIWNDIFLGNIKGRVENWNPENNWPSPEEVENDDEFYKLLNRFEKNIQETKGLIDSSLENLNKTQKISNSNTHELTLMKLFMTILQHISYHMGQIACVRRIVDDWPPT